MVCPYCHKEIPKDSVYCYHCGKELNKQQKQNSNNLKKNPHENSFAKFGLLLFFIALFGFDFVIGTIFKTIGINIKIPYMISTSLYVGAIICGILSLKLDKKDEQKGYQPTGNKNYAYISVFASIFVTLANIATILVK